MANPGYDSEKMGKLGKMLVKRQLTAKQLSAIYKVTTVAIKRMVLSLPKYGYEVTKSFAVASGKVGRRPLVFSAAEK